MKISKKTTPITNETNSEDKLISEKITSLESQVHQFEESWKRSLADYSNLEKRIDSQRQLFATLASISIITKMIEVLDDLYLAQAHLKDSGLQLAIDKFLTVLKSEGLSEISCDQIFDPNNMECIQTSDGEKNKVTSILKKGYLLNGQCIRPAQVIVGQGDDSAQSPTLSKS